ncbi:cytochrome P450 monooxygenase [Armillaria luteobubalina]|uniref:Cytochrome P450 monooxygenase n=1 Tax=Armillaria luteobubalina TaxID=153913 RepID=A0AA39Q5F6_9AGAR|nr:cytochrome P450 monooxygenase [Armillaria luteobubalina]
MLHLSLAKWSHTDLLIVAATVVVLVVLVHLVPYLVDSHGLRSYPGPLVAKFSDAWLGYTTYKGHRSEVVHDLHMRYGPFVRLAPNHISVALPDAQNIIYGHGNGALKSSFYEAFRFTSSYNMFTTQDRQIHTRKRKIVSHTFSPRSVLEFEPHVRHFVGQLIKQWDRLYDKALKGGLSGQEGEGWIGREGRLWLDWMGYLAFDIIGDLAFGAPFGMVKAAKDVVQVPVDQRAVMGSYGQTGGKYAVKEVPAIKGGRDHITATMGAIPKWLRLLLKRTPFFKQGEEGFRVIFGMAIMGISKRMQGLPIGQDELTTEAFSFIVAGSDTTSISTCAIIYHLACTPDAQDKLHKELDEHLDSDVATAERVKKLSYLEACINEGLRLHCTVGIGLHRVAADPGMMISGNCFPGGTVVKKYRPERWFECDSAAVSKAFTPFSVGPRACVGRNLAMLELQIIIASILQRFHFVLENPEQILEVKEGILRKPTGCRVGMKRREVF